MKGKNFVVINGRHYDAVTGVAISDTAVTTQKSIRPNKAFHDIGPAPRQTLAKQPVKHQVTTPIVSRVTSSTSHAVHKKPQKSQTLHRTAIKRPEAKAANLAAPAKSPLITRFGPNNSHIKPESTPKLANVNIDNPSQNGQKVHTAAKHVKAPAKAPTNAAAKSRALKEHLIKERLASVDSDTKNKRHKNSIQQIAKRQPRFASIITMSLAMVMLGGYLTYVNMPNLSVRVASARAGVDAQYPEYKPDGYSLAGPVAYAPGEVTLNFQSNGGSQKYEIKQRSSNWDSQAVLDNFVAHESENYLTYSEQGLTIYTYANKAAWVNGGILYTIKGDASLSSEQILKIAGSL